MPRIRRAVAVGATTLAAVLAPWGAGPALAEPPHVQVHYSDVYDVLLPDPADPNGSFCGGLVNVPLHAEVHGYFSIKDHGPNAPAPYFAEGFRSTLTYTNPETGLTFTVVKVRTSKDLRIVDNGDGTLTLTAQSTGGLWTYGPDGELAGSTRGLTRDTFLVDTKGTADLFDDEFSPIGEPFTAGLHETGDFCDDFFATTSQ